MSGCSVSPVAALSAQAEFNWLQTIVDNLIDGVLIVTMDGEWVYGNYIAHRICQQLNLGTLVSEVIPPSIWQVCQILLERDRSGCEHPVVIESEISLEHLAQYRVRVCWLQMEDAQRPYLLVTLEDRHKTASSRAISEVRQYGLTARQSDVWMLYRTGHTYREIATELFVTVNTVKRHMKDIHAKQKLIAAEHTNFRF
ncbi:MAG: helix-turn-helix transcriptional regulator [Leptolyngbyaceae cyanobacterium RU_5_1]|nr:helix-turn-helix transcriptional regulator [Leptolyngbyaceae cyanobacterium RU_5_1]